jgi:hypothetical protein
MRKILFMKLFILICTFAFSQNAVTVLEDENQESTIVTFVTTDGSFVPIRRDAGRIEFEETTSRIVIEQFEHILDAPGKIELEPGRYEFTLYDGGYDFVINATGGQQTWEIKPIDDSGVSAYMFFGGLGVSFLGYTYLQITSSGTYDDYELPLGLTVMGVGVVSMIASLVKWYVFDIPTVKRVN